MRLWIDLANSPHVPFFKALTNRFVSQGHEIETTASKELAEMRRLDDPWRLWNQPDDGLQPPAEAAAKGKRQRQR